MRKHSQVLLFLLSGGLLGVMVFLFLNQHYQLENQLLTAYQQVVNEIPRANVTGDISRLRPIMTASAIERLESFDFNSDLDEPIRIRAVGIASFSLLQNDESRATVSVVHHYAFGTYDSKTNQIVQVGDPIMWEGQTILMVMEDGTWKFDRVLEIGVWGTLQS